MGILSALNKAINILLNDPSDRYLYDCDLSYHRQIECKAYALGTLMQNLAREQLWPLPDAESVSESLEEFYERVTEYLWENYKKRPGHDCSIPKTLLAEIVAAVPRLQDKFPWPPTPVIDSLLSKAKDSNLLHYYDWSETKGTGLKYNCTKICTIGKKALGGEVQYKSYKQLKAMHW